MENFIKELRSNSKIAKVKTDLQPSLNDEVNYNKIDIVINTKKNLFDWAKAIYLVPDGDKFQIEMTCPNDPAKTLLKDIYLKHKAKDWDGKSKSYSTNPVINLEGDKELVKTLINYMYSTLN